MVILTRACGSSDESLQTCSTVREYDALLHHETLRAPYPSVLKEVLSLLQNVMLSASASAQVEALKLSMAA